MEHSLWLSNDLIEWIANKKYKKYKQDTGAEIKDVHYISRDEPVHSIYENADFSPKAIRDSIKEGEMKTTQILDEIAKTR